MTPFSLPRTSYEIMQNEVGSFIDTSLLIRGKTFKSAVVHTFRYLLDGLSLEYDEKDKSIEVGGLIVHPLYHEKTYYIGHVILFTNKNTTVTIGHRNAGFSYKGSTTVPKMKLTWQDDNLIVLEDRRRGVVNMMTPSEVVRADWN